MRALYIFPHPDDESFGPANAMHKQSREGHEIFLLTLTKGGATNKRHDYGLTVDEMGDVRYREMLNVKDVLKLKGLTVANLPDGGLKNIDPRIIEDTVKMEILNLKPEVVVSYPVHGISGFHDHLVTHAVVKRVFCEMRREYEFLKRLCFYTVSKETAESITHFKLSYSKPEEISCIVKTGDADVAKSNEALDCYKTYLDVIEKVGVRSAIKKEVPFEIFDEKNNEILEDIFQNLN